MADSRDEEIARLRFQLEVMRETIALYGNGALAAQALEIFELEGFPALGASTTSSGEQWLRPDSISFGVSIQTRNRQGQSSRVELSWYGREFRVSALDLRRCRVVLALVERR